jgi:RNA methyltransferase, TrmH family
MARLMGLFSDKRAEKMHSKARSTPLLSSRDNPIVRTIRLVAEQTRRAPAELVLAEGLRVLEEATQAGFPFEAVLAADGFGSEPRQRALLDAWELGDVPVRFAAAGLMKALSDVVTPQGALALVRVPERTLSQAPKSDVPLIVCLCGIQDPGNLGTLVRTARSAGASFVCTTLGAVSARNPKSIRASAGAYFRIPVIERLTPEEFCGYCRTQEIPMFQASAHGSLSCWDLNLRRPAAILLGNEARGFPEEGWSGVDSVRIPMSAGAESLNVAAAGAVLLFEALRQRSGLPYMETPHE